MLSQPEEKIKRIHPSSFTPSSSSSRLLEGLSSCCAGALCFSHHALLTRAALASGEELINSLTIATGCSPKHTSSEWFSLDQVVLQSARCGSHLRERLWSLSRSLARGWGSGLSVMSSTSSQSPESPQVRLNQPRASTVLWTQRCLFPQTLNYPRR